MRTRIFIVVLGLSLGLGARYGLDYYRHWRNAPASPAAPPAAKSPPATNAPLTGK